jgi:hypothetical protein
MSGKDDSPLDKKPAPPSASAGWAVTSYLIGGMAVYGGIGWLVGRRSAAVYQDHPARAAQPARPGRPAE